MAKKSSSAISRSYDVCLSFAGEDRKYVEAVARLLKIAGIRTFYDEFEKVSLWGKDLYSHLDDIYQNQATYCVIFISKHYAKKAWTCHERRSAQSRALLGRSEYILPVRFDDTEIPGIPNTVGFIDLKSTTENELCDVIINKVGPRPRFNYFPPVPDRLYKRFRARSRKDQEFLSLASHRVFQTLTRLSNEERGFVYDIFKNGCPAELPENIHISIDYLRRITGMQPAKIRRVAFGMQSLGFECSIRENHDSDDDGDHSGPILALEWHNRFVSDSGGNLTFLIDEMIDCATADYCDEHGREMFERLDFGQLANSTTTADQH